MKDAPWTSFTAPEVAAIVAAMMAAEGNGSGSVILPHPKAAAAAAAEAAAAAGAAAHPDPVIAAATGAAAVAAAMGCGSYARSQRVLRWGQGIQPTGMEFLPSAEDKEPKKCMVRRDDHKQALGGPAAWDDWAAQRKIRRNSVGARFEGLRHSASDGRGSLGSGAPLKVPDTASFAGGAGVLFAGEALGLAAPAAATREEVLRLWEPARLPLDVLFPECAGHEKSLAELGAVKDLVLGVGPGGRETAGPGRTITPKEAQKALLKFLRHADHVYHRRKEDDDAAGNRAKAVKLQAAEKAQLETLGVEAQEAQPASVWDIQPAEELPAAGKGKLVAALGCGEVNEVSGGARSRAGSASDDSFLKKPSKPPALIPPGVEQVFSWHAMYRTLAKIAGHFDCPDAGSFGLVVDPASAEDAQQGDNVTASIAAARGAPPPAFLRGAGRSPFDRALHSGLDDIETKLSNEMIVVDGATVTKSMFRDTAPPPDAVLFRNVFGHLY